MDNGQIIGDIKGTLSTAGWQHIKRKVAELAQADLAALAAPSRDGQPSDDFLRGRIDRSQFLLSGFENIIAGYEREQIASKLAGQDQPAVGTPYAPEAQPDHQANPGGN